MSAYVFLRPSKKENPELPSGPFIWEGSDGSRVNAFRIFHSYSSSCIRDLNQQLKVIQAESPVSSMCFYGVGDHGGGPTKEILSAIAGRIAEGEVMAFSSPDRYFEDFPAGRSELPVRTGELLHHASGCYVADGRIKRANRRAEWRLLAAERLAALAGMTAGPALPDKRIEAAWKDVLFCQFHDILAGTCESAVADEALEQYGRASQTASEILAESVQRIGGAVDTTGPGRALLVFNPHAFPVSGLVETDDICFLGEKWDPAAVHLLDASGEVAPHQRVRTSGLHNDFRLVFPAELPALGWRLFRLESLKRKEPGDPPLSPPAFAPLSGRLLAGEQSLENEHVRLTADENGLVRLKVMDGGWDAIAGGGQPLVLEDPSDTWGHDVRGFDVAAGTFALESRELVESGPLRARLRLRFKSGSSSLILDYLLERHASAVRVDALLDWREKRRVLKLVFPVQVESPVWTTECPYGEAVREADGAESPMHGWTDLSSETRGVAIANDSKYGVDVRDGAIRITVLRSPVYAHHVPQAVREDVEYHDQGVQRFRLLLIPHGAEWRPGVVLRSQLLNCPPVLSWEGTHGGRLAAVSGPLVEVNAGGVVIAAVKRAEDGGAWILRAFESGGFSERATFCIPVLGRSWSAVFGVGKIKSFVIPDAAAEPVRETNFLEN